MLHKLLTACFLIPFIVSAADEIGLADELVLQYGKSIRVGDHYSLSVKKLEEQQFACDNNRIAYDQIVVCQTAMMELRNNKIVELNREEGDITVSGVTNIIRITLGIEGEEVTNYTIELAP